MTYLPDIFSPQAVKTVDMFRRKTINLPYECMLFFDYNSGNIVSCNFSNSNSPNKVKRETLYIFILRMREYLDF